MGWNTSRTLLWCLAAAVLVPLARGASDEADRIAWEKDWKAAVERARAERRPIMIHFNMDDEPACAGMARGHFRNARIIELSKKFVCVVGSLGDHPTEDIFKDADHPGQCPRFGTVTCAEHRLVESDARSEVLQTSLVTAPQFVFVNPQLEILARKAYDFSWTELEQMMERALTYCNPDLAPSDLEAKRREIVEELLEDGDSDNAETRNRALSALVTRDDPEIIRFLLRQTSPNVDEVKRLEAIKAIGEAGNANCLTTLVGILGDRSISIRRHTIIALYKLNMVEAVPELLARFGRESNDRNKALMLRTCTACAPAEKEVIALLRRCLRANDDLLRVQAIAASLNVTLSSKDYERVVSMTKGDTDKSVRAVACSTATSIGVAVTGGLDWGVKVEDRDAFAKIVEKKLKPALSSVARGDRDDKLRSFAASCLASLGGPVNEEEIADAADVTDFYDVDSIFVDEEGTRQRRGGGGRGR